MRTPQTVIITGASSGIGLALTKAFLARGARVVANSRHVSTAGTLTPSPTLALVDGDIARPDIAAQVIGAADRFGSLDLLVNNAGIFIPKPFVDYTAADVAAPSRASSTSRSTRCGACRHAGRAMSSR